MAVDKLVDSTKLDACCAAEAAAIIAKGGGTAPLAYDFSNNKGFADAIASIPTGGGGGGTEITLTSTPTLARDFAKAIFPNFPNGFTPNKFYVCVWNGLFDGSIPVADQVGYLSFWARANGSTEESGGSCLSRYRNNQWLGLAAITNNWTIGCQIGDKYTVYEL